MNKGAILAISLIMTGYLFSSAIATEQITTEENTEKQEIVVTEEEKQDASVHNFPLASVIAGSNLEKQKRMYLKEHNLRLGFDRKGSYIGWGMATIETSPKQIDFGQKRIGAFEKAFTDAKGGFVRTKKQDIAVKVMKQFMHYDPQKEPIEIKDGKVKGLSKKILALGEAEIDNMLRKLGVDPKDIENSDIVKKRILAKDSFEKTIGVSAIQAVSGIRILATFEDVDAVGVLIKQSRHTSDLAQAIASQNLVGYPSQTDPVDSITNQLDTIFTTDGDYMSQYGVRIMVDKYGNRVLLSFGQWSPQVTRSDAKMTVNLAIQAAKEHAHNLASSYMTQFIRTTLALNSNTGIADVNEIVELEHANSMAEKVPDSTVGATLDKFIEETSNATIEGETEVKQWAVNHPETGHLIVGKVVMWSPITQEYARQKPRTGEVHGVKKENEDADSKHEIHKSRDIGDEDF